MGLGLREGIRCTFSNFCKEVFLDVSSKICCKRILKFFIDLRSTRSDRGGIWCSSKMRMFVMICRFVTISSDSYTHFYNYSFQKRADKKSNKLLWPTVLLKIFPACFESIQKGFFEDLRNYTLRIYVKIILKCIK